MSRNKTLVIAFFFIALTSTTVVIHETNISHALFLLTEHAASLDA